MNSRGDNTDKKAVVLWSKTDKKNSIKRPTLWNSEKAEQPIGKSASSASQNAKEAAIAALPIITAAGVTLLTQKGDYNLSALGVPVIIGGIVIDTIKAPFCLAVATEEAIRAGITKLVSLLFEKPASEMLVERVFKSFLSRMQETATLLILLELENAEVLNRKLKEGDIEDLIGLTLLHTAYASRHYSLGLLLANSKTLHRMDCPEEGLALFDEITNCKDTINAALKSSCANFHRMSEKERDIEESRLVCQWIKLIKIGKLVTSVDKPDATILQIELVNKIITKIDDLKRCGMMVLPEEPQVLASRLSGLKR